MLTIKNMLFRKVNDWIRQRVKNRKEAKQRQAEKEDATTIKELRTATETYNGDSTTIGTTPSQKVNDKKKEKAVKKLKITTTETYNNNNVLNTTMKMDETVLLVLERYRSDKKKKKKKKKKKRKGRKRRLKRTSFHYNRNDIPIFHGISMIPSLSGATMPFVKTKTFFMILVSSPEH